MSEYKEVPEWLSEALGFYDKAMEAKGEPERRQLLAQAVDLFGRNAGITATREIHFQPLIDMIKGEGGNSTAASLAVFQIEITAEYGNYPPDISQRITGLIQAIEASYS